MKLVHRTDLAIEFLKKLRPDGPWVLTAILPNKGHITTQTFTAAQLEVMRVWIEGFQHVRNLYYTLNSVRNSIANKPQKTDISELYALHCDCDPRPGEDFAEERIRILEKLKKFQPQPSIIDSGNGYQALFLLQSPVVLDGTVEMAEEYESYNRQLEILLEGDHCFNIDRVLRLPGTINIPDEKKIKRGRVPTLSSLVQWVSEPLPLAIFTKAPIKIQQAVTLGGEQLPGGGEKVHISGNIAPVYVEDLASKNIAIKDDIKVLIVQGYDPDNLERYKSRSEALWAVTCALVRADASDEVIAGVLLNKSNGISGSVLDKPRPERYAAKQIQDAREEVDDPILRELNSKHAVISDIGGKCKIISEVFDYALKRPRVSHQSFPDFKNRYLNKPVQVAVNKNGEPVTKAAGDWWVTNPKRRQYETIVFAPGREVPQAYNLWQGFACEAIPGDCSLFLEHIEKNLCQGNKEYNTYLLGWMARAVQQPDCPGEVAVVLRGEMGTGKSVFAKLFGSLFGRHFLQVSDPKHLVGSFNAHLRDCVVLFGDEAFYAGDKKHESVLKALVTEEHLAVEYKGVDIFAAPNYTHIILASNSAWVVPAGSNERRYFALDVGAAKIQDSGYFSAMKDQMDNGGKEALLHFLLTYDISSYEVRSVPKTAALQDQKILSSSPEEIWWFEKLEEGRILREHDTWERSIQKLELQNDYITFMTRVGIMRKASATILGKFLGRACPGGVPRAYQQVAQVKMHGQYGEEYFMKQRVYFYEFPTIQECRDHWDKHYGGPFKWNPPLEKPEPEQVYAEAAFK